MVVCPTLLVFLLWPYGKRKICQQWVIGSKVPNERCRSMACWLRQEVLPLHQEFIPKQKYWTNLPSIFYL